MKLLEAKPYKHLLSILLDGRPLFELPYQCVVDGMAWFADSLEVNGLRVEARIGDTLISDTISLHEPLVCVTRRWSLRGKFSARVMFTAFAKMEPTLWVAPGVVYASGGGLAALAAATGPIREEAASAPACSVLQSADRVFAVFAQPAESVEELSSLAVHISKEHSEFNISIPGATPAKSGIRGHSIEFDEWDVDGQVTYERRFYLWSNPPKAGGWETVLEAAREIASPAADSQPDMGAIARARARHLVENFFIERTDCVGFVESVGQTMFPASAVMRGAGRGGNIDAARALCRVAAETDDRRLKRIALDTADFFLSGDDPELLPYVNYSPPSRKWSRPEDPPALRTAAAQIISAVVKLNSAAGPDSNPRWMFTCRRICDKFMAAAPQESEEGEAPAGLSAIVGVTPENARADAELAAAFALFGSAVGDRKYIDAALALAAPLVPAFTARIVPGPESAGMSSADARAFIRMCLALKNEPNGADFMAAAKRAASYVDSLTYIRDVPFHEGTTLAQAGFRAMGGLLPAPGALEFDDSAAECALEMFQLREATGDDRFRALADTMLRFSLQMVSVGSPAHGLLHSFEGFQPSAFYHTGDPASKGPWGGCSRATLSRVPVSALNALLDIRDKYPDAASFTIEPLAHEHSFPSAVARALLSLGCRIRFF